MKHTNHTKASGLLRFFQDIAMSFFVKSSSEDALQSTRKGQYFRKRCMILAIPVFVLLSSPLSAQNNAELVVSLIERVGKVEEENRDLRGQIEEARHDIAILKQRLETLSADVDYRLTNPESGAPAPQAIPSSPTAPAPQGAPRPEDRPSQGIKPVEPAQSQSNGPSDPTDEYEKARALLEQGEYEAAEKAFAAFVAAHSKDKNAGAAQYWLGVTFFVRGQHEDAAAAFAKGYKTHPKSPKAPDNLMKLAKSLTALNRTADACTTLKQLSSEHPKALVNEVAREKENWGCR